MSYMCGWLYRFRIVAPAVVLIAAALIFPSTSLMNIETAQAKSRQPISDPTMACAVLFETLKSDPYTRPSIMTALKDATLVGGQPQTGSRANRAELVSMISDPSTKPMVVQAVKYDLRRSSDEVRDAIDAAQSTGFIDPTAQVYDIVMIGAGPNETVLSTALHNLSGFKTLTVERTDTIASTFEDGFWYLNSSTRASNPNVVPKPGRGNLNELPGGGVQLPDATTEVWPRAGDLADVVAVNRASAATSLDSGYDNRVLFKSEIVQVETKTSVVATADPREAGLLRPTAISKTDENGNLLPQYSNDAKSIEWPAKYRLEVRGADGKKRYVYSNALVDVRGLGDDSLPFKDPNSLRTVASVRAKAPRGKYPRIMTYGEFRSLAKQKDTPYREFTDKKVLVVGPKDGGRTWNEFLFRQGPKEAYKRDVTQVGDVFNVDWSGVTAKDCVDFINNIRVRYSRLAGPIKSEKLKPQPAKLVAVDQRASGMITTRFEKVFTPEEVAKFTDEERNDVVSGKYFGVPEKRLQSLDTPRAYKMETAEDGSIRVTFDGPDYDYVLVSAGQDPNPQDIYRGLVTRDTNGNAFGPTNPFLDSSSLTPVLNRVQGQDAQAAVALRLTSDTGPENIFVTGARAQRNIKVEELAGVTDNTVSLFAHGPRDYSFGQWLTENIDPIKGLPRLAPRAPTPLETSRIPSRVPKGRDVLTVPKNASIYQMSPAIQQYLTARFIHVFADFKLPKSTKIGFSITRSPSNPEQYKIDIRAPLTQAAKLRLIERMDKDMDLMALVDGAIGANQRHNSIDVEVVSDGASRIDYDRSTMQTGIRSPSKLEQRVSELREAAPMALNEVRQNVRRALNDAPDWLLGAATYPWRYFRLQERPGQAPAFFAGAGALAYGGYKIVTSAFEDEYDKSYRKSREKSEEQNKKKLREELEFTERCTKSGGKFTERGGCECDSGTQATFYDPYVSSCVATDPNFVFGFTRELLGTK